MTKQERIEFERKQAARDKSIAEFNAHRLVIKSRCEARMRRLRHKIEAKS